MDPYSSPYIIPSKNPHSIVVLGAFRPPGSKAGVGLGEAESYKADSGLEVPF